MPISNDLGYLQLQGNSPIVMHGRMYVCTAYIHKYIHTRYSIQSLQRRCPQ